MGATYLMRHAFLAAGIMTIVNFVLLSGFSSYQPVQLILTLFFGALLPLTWPGMQIARYLSRHTKDGLASGTLYGSLLGLLVGVVSACLVVLVITADADPSETFPGEAMMVFGIASLMGGFIGLCEGALGGAVLAWVARYFSEPAK